MYNKYTPLLSFLLSAFFVLGVSAFAAKATLPAAGVKTIPANVAEFAQPAFNEGATEGAFMQAAPGKPSAPPINASLGYYMVAGTVNIGSTGFDQQSNDRQQRQIVVGCNGNIHNVFMYRPVGGTGSDREIDYVAYVPGAAPPAQSAVSPGTGGYSAIDAGSPTTGRAVAAWHYTYLADTSYTQCGMQPTCASPTFPWMDYPFPPNCQGIKTGLGARDNYYIWPSIAVDDHGGQPIAHIVSMEYSGDATTPVRDTTGKRSLIYYKSVDGINGGSSLTCGTFIDSMYSLNSVVVADPNSDKVAIVYTRPRSWTPPEAVSFYGRDNVVYRESSDLGATWGAMVQVTNYSDTEELEETSGMRFVMRANEVSALYDDSSHLHIVWNTFWADSATRYYLVFPAKLYHWDNSRNCISLIYDASNYGAGSNCFPGGGNDNIAKVNLSMCDVSGQKRFYAVYTRYRAYTTTDSTFSDCSAGKFQNGEVFVQGSATYGLTWGEALNLSNTTTNGCAAGACNSENFTNAAMYVTDSLRIQYLLDKDAGNAVVYAEGTQTDNPMMNLSYPCYTIESAPSLTAEPAEFIWPLHSVPGGATVFNVTLTNVGNASANYTRTVNYIDASGWLAFNKPANGTVPAGCTNSEVTQITATGPVSEGLYRAQVQWSYDAKIRTVPVDVYNFADSNWVLEEKLLIRTACAKVFTAQTSRAGCQKAGGQFNFFGDPLKGYLFDASLLIGTSANTISMQIFADSSGVSGHGDNAIGRLFAATDNYADSTSSDSYRYAAGSGYNRDSTIGIEAEFYAPKHVDSCGFFIGRFDIYATPKNPDTTVNNVTIAYAADWDVPDDSSKNLSGADADLSMVYQQGWWGANSTRYAAIAGFIDDDTGLVGAEAGFVLDNPTWVYGHQGYESDSIWDKIQTASGFTKSPKDSTDLNSILVFARGRQLKATPFTIFVIFAAEQADKGLLDNVKASITKAVDVIKNKVWQIVKARAKVAGKVEVWLTKNCVKKLKVKDIPTAVKAVKGWANKRYNDLLVRWTVKGFVIEAKVTKVKHHKGVWSLEPLNDYVVSQPLDSIPLPLVGDTTGKGQNIYYVVDLDSVAASPPQWQGSYSVQNGKCAALPGYLIGTQPIVFSSNDPTYPFSTTAPFSGTLPNDGDVTLVKRVISCTMCGDANGDGTFDISDAVFLIQYIFVPGSPAPGPCGAPDGLGDANGDGTVDISDAVYLIQYIFVPGSPAPTCP